MATLANLDVRIGVRAEELRAGLDKAERRLDRFGRKASNAGRRMTTGLTLPIVAIGTAATKAFVDFETAMTGVAKTVDAPVERIDELGRTFQDLSERIPVSANELAGIAEVAGQLGVEVENIAEFTETVAALGVSTNLSSEQAATGLARLGNVMGVSTDQVDQMGSALVALGNNLEANEEEILRTTTFFRAIASSVGASTAEVLGLAGAIRRAGIRAQAGGSGIMVTFQTMQQAIEGVNDGLGTFADVVGMSAARFSELFRADPTEALLQFVEGLEQIQKSGGSVNRVLERLGLQDRRVTRTLIGLANAGEKTREAVDIATEGFEENVALAEEARKFYDRLGAQFQTFVNRVVNVAVELGRALAPSLVDAVEAAAPLLEIVKAIAQAFAALPRPLQSVIVGVTGLLAAMGPMAFVIGEGAQAIASLSSLASKAAGVVVNMANASLTATGAVSKMGAALSVLASGPVLALLAAGGTAFLAIRALEEHSRNAAPEVKNLASQMDALVQQTKQLADADIEKTVASLQGRLAAVRAELASFEGQSPLRSAIGAGLVGVPGLQGIGQAVIGQRAEARERLRAQAEILEQGIMDLRSSLGGTAQQSDAANMALDRLEEQMAQASGSTRTASDVMGDMETSLRVLKDRMQLFGDAVDFGAERTQIIKNAIVEMLELGLRPSNVEIQRLINRLHELEGLRSQAPEGLPHTQKVDVPKVSDEAKNLVTAADRANEAFQAVKRTIAFELSEAMTGLITNTQNWGEAFKSIGKSILQTIQRIAVKLLIIKPILEALNIGSPFAGGFAAGGRIPAGQVGLVGEEGPELISGPATITPMDGGRQVTVQNNFNFSAIDARGIEQMLREQKGTIAQVTAEAAAESDGFRRSLVTGK